MGEPPPEHSRWCSTSGAKQTRAARESASRAMPRELNRGRLTSVRRAWPATAFGAAISRSSERARRAKSPRPSIPFHVDPAGALHSPSASAATPTSHSTRRASAELGYRRRRSQRVDQPGNLQLLENATCLDGIRCEAYEALGRSDVSVASECTAPEGAARPPSRAGPRLDELGRMCSVASCSGTGRTVRGSSAPPRWSALP